MENAYAIDAIWWTETSDLKKQHMWPIFFQMDLDLINS